MLSSLMSKQPKKHMNNLMVHILMEDRLDLMLLHKEIDHKEEIEEDSVDLKVDSVDPKVDSVEQEVDSEEEIEIKETQQ